MPRDNAGGTRGAVGLHTFAPVAKEVRSTFAFFGPADKTGKKASSVFLFGIAADTVNNDLPIMPLQGLRLQYAGTKVW